MCRWKHAALLLSAISCILIACEDAGAANDPKKIVIGYVFPRNGVMPDMAIAPSLLTHINYAFANIRNGRPVLERAGDAANLGSLAALRSASPQLRVLVSVGGWTWSGGFSDMSLTRSSRKVFIDGAMELIRAHRLDGIDLDWEYPGLPGAGNTHRPADKRNFTLLLGELRGALSREQRKTGKRYLLTIAAGAGQSYLAHTEMRKAQKYLDYVNLMTYDFFVEGGGKSGHHSNLHPSEFAPGAPSCSATVSSFMRAGVPAKKLVLGVPFYGRGWKGAASANNGLYQEGKGARDGYSWKNLVSSYIDKNGFTRWWDVAAMAPYLWKPDEGRVVTYDDPESLGWKCLFVKKRKLAGVMFWEYGEDDPEHTLLRTLHNHLRELKTTAH